MMNFKNPPIGKNSVIGGKVLAQKLSTLIGRKFPLSDNPKTNGSILRKILIECLDDGSMNEADKKDYIVVPKKGKGIPHLLACLSDSYIVTTGDKYNLQVWNRLPDTQNDLIRYTNGKTSIKCRDIRFIFVRIDVRTNIISGIIVATPGYIVDKFGPFGVPTIKYQMIISNLKRIDIVKGLESCFFKTDTNAMSKNTVHEYIKPNARLASPPIQGHILSLECIKERIVGRLIGLRLPYTDAKTRGQALERIVANLLGYDVNDSLVGGYPDIPNQLLEIKIQDSPTVDLGKYSPSRPVVVNEELNVTTEDVRYIIALTDREGVIEGIIISPGVALCDEFTCVNDTSYKCQRSIPMAFFEKYVGKSVFNP